MGTSLDSKFSKSINVGGKAFGKEMVEQRSKDIADIKRDLARKNDTLIKQYMKDVYEQPAKLSNDKLT